MSSPTHIILIADDDPDDRDLLLEAFEEIGVVSVFKQVEDGEELLDYLNGRGKWTAADAPRPSLIMLDLNMPRKDGREALRDIRRDPALRAIPIVVFSTSGSPDDVTMSYDNGANSFIRKPGGWDSLLAAVKKIHSYWFDTARLPADPIKKAS